MKRLLHIILLLTAFLGGANLMGQQDPQYSQYMFNGLVLNPAYAGSRDMMSGTLIARQQWTGFEGAPSTQSFSFHSPSKNLRNGFGVSLWHDRLGPSRAIDLSGCYALRLPVGEEGTLSLGIQGSLRSFTVNFAELNLQNGSDPSFSGTRQSNVLPNAGAGLYFKNKFMYLGGSVPHLINHRLSGTEPVPPNSAGMQVRHYLLTGGFIVPLGPNVKFKPSVLMKMAENAPFSLDINGSFLFAEKFWLGASWRQNSDLVFIFEWQASKQFRIGYAYDYLLSPIQGYSSGSHELMLGFDLDFERSKMASPRYF